MRLRGDEHTGNGQLALTLQERSVGVDELLRLSREKKGPISNDSVIRSLSTPSRLLHCSSHVLYLAVFPLRSRDANVPRRADCPFQ